MTNLNSIRKVYNLMDRYGVELGYYRALNFADALVQELDNSTPAWQKFNPATLADIAAAVPAVREEILADRKIQAIKELRQLTAAGLKETKDAVEAVWDQVKLEYLREKLGQ